MQNNNRISKKPSLALASVFLTAALAVGIAERWIPFDFAVPGVKLGLSNSVILTALYLFRTRDALKIALLKCVLTALLSGAGVSFFYSISGTLISFAVMSVAVRFSESRFSHIGVSVLGAIAHNIGQIIASAVIMRSFYVVSYLPVLIISGVITGVIVGAVVKGLLKAMKNFYKN